LGRGKKWLNVVAQVRSRITSIVLSGDGRYGSVWVRPSENLYKSCSLSSRAVSESDARAGKAAGHGNLRYATHFMVSFLRFLAQERKMPGFPTHIVGTPTIRGKARRYEGSREDKGRSASGKECRRGQEEASVEFGK